MSLKQNDNFYESLSDSRLETLLGTIALLKNKADVLEDQLRPIKGALEDAKNDLMAYMTETGSKRTDVVDGYFVVRSERVTPHVTDQEAVLDYLESNDLPVDDYLKLDEARIKALAESALKETGEIVPGITFDSTEYLTVRKETK